MPVALHEGEGLGNPESRPGPNRTGLVIKVDNLANLKDSDRLPLKGINISPKTLSVFFGGEFRPSESSKYTRTSDDGSRREDSRVVATSWGGADTIRISDRVLEMTGSRQAGLTELHSSARRISTFEAIYVPKGEEAIFTYPSHHERIGTTNVSYGDLVSLKVSGAMVVMPGGVPYDVAPADGESVRYMHATNHSSLSGTDAPKPVRHIEALNMTKDGQIKGSDIYARGHGLGIGREVTGLQGEETMIMRETTPEVTISDIIDTRNLVPDSIPQVSSETVLLDTHALSTSS